MTDTRQPTPLPTITVKGVGEASVEPDRVALNFSVSCKEWNYGDAISGLNDRVGWLRNAIESCGLDRKELRTSDFDVDRETRWDSAEDEHVFDGYEASHSLRIVMPLDQDKLNEVLQSITDSYADASFSIYFETSREAELADKVMTAAVANARHKAEVLVAAAGQKLGQLLHIGHSWSEVHLSSTRYSMDKEMCYAPAAPDIEPEEISSSDSVEVVWALA